MTEQLSAVFVATGLATAFVIDEDHEIHELALAKPYSMSEGLVTLKPTKFGCHMNYKLRRGTTAQELRAAATEKVNQWRTNRAQSARAGA